MPTKNSFAQMHEDITGWRRHLHENPELLFDVHETAAFVEERLKEFGVAALTTGVGQTGVVAVMPACICVVCHALEIWSPSRINTMDGGMICPNVPAAQMVPVDRRGQ